MTEIDALVFAVAATDEVQEAFAVRQPDGPVVGVLSRFVVDAGHRTGLTAGRIDDVSRASAGGRQNDQRSGRFQGRLG